MKQVELNNDTPRINVGEINQNKKYAYQSDSGELHVLSKLGDRYVDNVFGRYHFGFVNVSRTERPPVFLAKEMKDTITKALNRGRVIVEFNSLKELLEWKLNILQK